VNDSRARSDLYQLHPLLNHSHVPFPSVYAELSEGREWIGKEETPIGDLKHHKTPPGVEMREHLKIVRIPSIRLPLSILGMTRARGGRWILDGLPFD